MHGRVATNGWSGLYPGATNVTQEGKGTTRLGRYGDSQLGTAYASLSAISIPESLAVLSANAAFVVARPYEFL